MFLPFKKEGYVFAYFKKLNMVSIQNGREKLTKKWVKK